MDALTCLKTRRSVRKFSPDPVPKVLIDEILECGRWAPSGINVQPWRVLVITRTDVKDALAGCTVDAGIIKVAPCLLAIFLDKAKGYDYVKSVQSIGAFFENLLLAIHAVGLGGVWLGEIYAQKARVHEVLNITEPRWEFMGAIAFGNPAETGESDRVQVEGFTTYLE
nr:nitroreductase [Candidatus Sigynarchaeota archaeon]